MAYLAKDVLIWLPDGTTASIEEVVARRLPVLSYDKAWDTRPVRYGPSQVRDMTVGRLEPARPVAWLDNGVRPVRAIKFVSGRTIEATLDHRWVTLRQTRAAWEWKTTAELKPGDKVPMPLTAGFFGDSGRHLRRLLRRRDARRRRHDLGDPRVPWRPE